MSEKLEKTKRVTVDLPLDLWREFAKKCLDENKTKKQVLLELIGNYVKKGNLI